MGGLHQYAPIVAHTSTVHRASGPVAYDCVRITVVRDGSAIVFSEFGQRPVTVGNAIVLGANVLCGYEPEGHVTVTTIYLDTDYVLDVLFWQYAEFLHDRLDAERFAKTVHSEPAQILSLGEQRAGMLMPWLDELVRLSVNGKYPERFSRMQSLWFAIADVIAPYVRVSAVRLSPTQRARARPTIPRHRRYAPMRPEVRQVRDLLSDNSARSWSLDELAAVVHLSPKQLSRLFADTFGLTPRAYQTRLRVAEMARILRETDVSIAHAGRLAGWNSRSRAHDAFSECTGMSPREYRNVGVPSSPRTPSCQLTG